MTYDPIAKKLIILEQIAMYEEFLEEADKALFKLYKAKEDLEQGAN
jgi:hypothetical protein